MDMAESEEQESWLTVQSSFDDRLRRKLPLGYIRLPMAFEEISCTWVRNLCLPAGFCELETDDKHEQVAPFLRAFATRNWHRTNVFVSKPSLLFLRELTWFYGTEAAVNESNLATEVVPICEIAKQPKDRPLVL